MFGAVAYEALPSKFLLCAEPVFSVMPVLASPLCPEADARAAISSRETERITATFGADFSLGAIDVGADADALVFFRVVVFFVVSVIRMYLLRSGLLGGQEFSPALKIAVSLLADSAF